MTERVIKELDVVELLTATGRWATGTVGTVVEVFEGSVLVEIDDQATGRTEDLVSLPPAAVRVLPQHQQGQLLTR